jgi:hypothetical protein
MFEMVTLIANHIDVSRQLNSTQQLIVCEKRKGKIRVSSQNLERNVGMWEGPWKCGIFSKNVGISVGKLCFLWPARFARKKLFKSAITNPSAQGKNKNSHKGAKP